MRPLPIFEDPCPVCRLVADAQRCMFRVVFMPKDGMLARISGPRTADVDCVGICDPSSSTLLISADLRGKDLVQVLAHEVGHARQVHDGSYAGFFNYPFDPESVYRGELAAIERMWDTGIDMFENWQANRLGYAEVLGLAHMGRS